MISQILDRVNAENDTHFHFLEELIHLGYAEDVRDGVSICNECVAICAMILLDKRAAESMDKEERAMVIVWR